MIKQSKHLASKFYFRTLEFKSNRCIKYIWCITYRMKFSVDFLIKYQNSAVESLRVQVHKIWNIKWQHSITMLKKTTKYYSLNIHKFTTAVMLRQLLWHLQYFMLTNVRTDSEVASFRREHSHIHVANRKPLEIKVTNYISETILCTGSVLSLHDKDSKRSPPH